MSKVLLKKVIQLASSGHNKLVRKLVLDHLRYKQKTEEDNNE